MFCKIYFIYVYVNTYKYIYSYMYVYIWDYANPFKLTFVWWVFSLGFRFVYVQEVEKYFCSKKRRVVIHIAKRFKAHQTVLMLSRQLYCTAEDFTIESFNAQQTTLMHIRKLYCTAGNFIAQQKVLLHSRKVNSLAEIGEKFLLRQKLKKSSFCSKNWRKVPSVAEIEFKHHILLAVSVLLANEA